VTCGPEGFYVGGRIVDDATIVVMAGDAMEVDEAIMGLEEGVKSRFRELLEQHPELTRSQAYLLAVMEIVGYRDYLVPPELAPGVLAHLESNDH